MTAKSGIGSMQKRETLRRIFGIGAGIAGADALFAGGASAAGRPGAEPAGWPNQQTTGPATGAGSRGWHDVTAYGAKGDGSTLDSPAINRAIEAAAKAQGGTVYLPAGHYLSYSIRLKSNITLRLGAGATLVAADPPPEGQSGGYDAPEPCAWDQYQDFGHSHFHNALIWGEGLQNISIIGPGLIWGKGLRRFVGKRGYAGLGDKSISLKSCHNVTLRDFSVLHGGHFGILATGVDNLTIDNLLIDTNRDGMDIDCCHNVRVSNCTVNSPWDDGICPKSSYALGYGRATENLTITNCFVTGGYEEGTLLDGTFKLLPPGRRPHRIGRIKLGTESYGGFKNITVSNCVFEHCYGLALETVDGALLEDVTITNITMRDVVGMPVFLRLGSRLRGPQGTTVGKLRRVMISNIVASNSEGGYASILSGIPGHNIEDVHLSDIYVLHQGGGTAEQAAINLPEKEAGYPEPVMFGPTPSYGFYVRHASGLEMRNIELKLMNPDARPPIILKDVDGADLLHIKAERGAGKPLIVLNQVKDFSIYLSRPIADQHLDEAAQKDLP